MGVYEVLKDAVTLAQKADNVDLLRKLLDAQKELLDLQAENQKLRTENAKLRDDEDIGKQLEHLGDAYWDTRNGQRVGPYCTVCWDVDRRLVRLTESATRGTYSCGYCPTRYAGR